MLPQTFRALLVQEDPAGSFTRQVVSRSPADLPAGEVTVQVLFSSLNYKDALSASGNRGVTRNYPHTPGIDAAGVVVESSSPLFKTGDAVLAASPELGVSVPGGFGQFVRGPAGWFLPLPSGLSAHESMIYGTAGFTAALCLHRLLEAGLQPSAGPLLVTGATGGVGSLAVALAAGRGFAVTAVTGKEQQAGFLQRLGAAEVLARQQFLTNPEKPLLPGRWAGVIDTTGGSLLATAIRAALPDGLVATCGNTAGPELALTVFPFILRGVSLLGIDATRTPAALRAELWQRLAGPWRVARLRELARTVSLGELGPEIDSILHGGQVGRVVVNLSS